MYAVRTSVLRIILVLLLTLLILILSQTIQAAPGAWPVYEGRPHDPPQPAAYHASK